MRRLSLTAIIMTIAATTVTAQTQTKCHTKYTDRGARHGQIAVVDMNNDGYRDLFIAGVGNYVTNASASSDYQSNRMTHAMLFNPTFKSWTVKGLRSVNVYDDNMVISVCDRPSITPCDINMDGIMDIVAFETTGRTFTETPFLDHTTHQGVFLGNGDGTFKEAILTFSDEEGKPVDLDMRKILAADVADFNNDGMPDIAAIGYHVISGSVKDYEEYNVILMNKGGGHFVVSHYTNGSYLAEYGQEPQTYHFQVGEVNAYDFNNDGYVDFMINAQSDHARTLGVNISTSTHFTEIYLNDPQHPGHFRRQYIYDSSRHANPFTPMSEGGVAIADFDDDGMPDIFTSGWTGNNRQKYVWGLARNITGTDGTLEYGPLSTDGLSEMRNQTSTNTQYGAFDWNGDGEFDIINMGWSTRISTQTCFVSTGDGTGKFTETERMAGGSEGSLAFCDWNKDGKADFIMMAQTDDDTFFTTDGLTSCLAVTLNGGDAPAKPDAPSLSQPSVENGKVSLAWTDAATSKKNVTYEYYVKDADGNLVAGGNSFTDGELSGTRKVMKPGNAYNSRKVTLYLPDGTYTYGVQTVNAALEGSAFATGSFTVSGSSVERNTDDFKVVEVPETNSKGVSYTNPVINTSMPDPTVIRANDGYFYIYSTEDTHNVPVRRSADLVKWEYVGTAFNNSTRPTFLSGGAIWAPDINYIDGKYVMYYTLSKWGEEHANGIGVAYADRPEGPFGHSKKLFTSDEIGVQNSIDQFYIEEDGHKYLFWGSFRGIYAIELSDDGLSLKEGATKTQVAGTLTEATCIVKHDGYFYLIGSAGSCCDGANSSYHLVVARSQNILGPYVSKTKGSAMNNSFSNLLYKGNDFVGPGHCSEVVTDDKGDSWLLYHGYKAKDTDAGRVVLLDKMEWDEEGWPYIKDACPSRKAPAPEFNPLTAITLPTINDIKGDATVSLSAYRVTDNLEINKSDGAEFSWTIASTDGKKLKSGKATAHADIDVYDIPEGLFLISVKSKTGRFSAKVLKR